MPFLNIYIFACTENDTLNNRMPRIGRKYFTCEDSVVDDLKNFTGCPEIVEVMTPLIVFPDG